MVDKSATAEKPHLEEKPAAFGLPNIAKKLRRTRQALKILGGSAVTIAILAVALPFVGAVMICSLAVRAIVFIGVLSYSLKQLRDKTPIKVNIPFTK